MTEPYGSPVVGAPRETAGSAWKGYVILFHFARAWAMGLRGER